MKIYLLIVLEAEVQDQGTGSTESALLGYILTTPHSVLTWQRTEN